MKKENVIDLVDALQLKSDENIKEKMKKLKEIQKMLEKTEKRAIKKEEHIKDFYDKKIEKLCSLNEISISKIQKNFQCGFSEATKIFDILQDKKYIFKNEENHWIILDKTSLSNYLTEYFKNKL